MEKAILKTLIYADIFDYPLKINEIHKWLIGKKVTLRQLEKALGKLVGRLQVFDSEVAQTRGVAACRRFYYLPKRKKLISKRLEKARQSEVYLKKARMLAQVLKVIPWIKLVGISGGLALNNAGKYDDIDLFIVTAKNRLWVSRLLALGLLSLTGQRRKAGESGKKVAGKICANILVEEDKLEQKNKDIYTAHEVLQMKVLWQRNGIYSKYLYDNEWVFKFLPNWVDSSLRAPKGRGNLVPQKIASSHSLLAMTWMEGLAKWFQLKIMQKQKGMERIEDGALYFHPQDCRLGVLSEYKKKLSRFFDSWLSRLVTDLISP
ncbi:hypothetical protein HYU95_03375 [Candidatus Daviesbacteria bacterium]|nr:hypothetical protein [Candidatus Daviesbacteria bacterium]